MARRHGQPVTFWLTRTALRSLDLKAQEAEQSRAALLRSLVWTHLAGWDVTPKMLSQLRAHREELRRIGINLNQAVKLAHRYRQPTRALQEHLGLVARALAKLVKTLETLEQKA